MWDRTHPRQIMPTRRPGEQTALAVAELEIATADELAAYVGLHGGNVRKHLLPCGLRGVLSVGMTASGLLLPMTVLEPPSARLPQ
jgi:hypothetical protein